MNELLKLLLLNPGKTIGAGAGFVLAVFLVALGLPKTLFIAALVVLGYLLGKWHDEGISLRKLFRDIIDSLRHHKWR